MPDPFYTTGNTRLLDTQQIPSAPIGGTPYPMFADFDWNVSRFPLQLFRDGLGRFRTSFDPKTDLDEIRALFDGLITGATKVYYADRSRADNGGNGLTAATAKQAIHAARTVGEQDATATGILIMVAAGDYDRTTDFANTTASGGTVPTKPCAVIGFGGTVVVGPTALLGAGWTVDGDDASGKTYKATRSAVNRVINKLALDSRGKGVPMAKAANAAAVYASTAADAYNVDGSGILRVRRADGLPVTDANTRALLNASSCTPGPQPFYTSGIDWVGGLAGTLQRNSAAHASTNPVAAEACAFLYPGPDGSPSNCITVDFDGLTYLGNCTYGYTTSDAVNPHGNQVGAGRCHVLVNGGDAYSVGQPGMTSCNVTTGHGDDVVERGTRLIELMLRGVNNRGGARRYVGASQALILGGASDSDASDGTFPSSGPSAEDDAKVFVVEHEVVRCDRGLYAGQRGVVYHRNCLLNGSRMTTANAGRIVRI